MSALDVKLVVFEGPLDLLLHLIDKNKVNIYDIPIVTITEQYLDYVSHMEEENLEVMSEFLVMAATLIRIKSRMLLPKEEEEDVEEDPRDELVKRLLEYKMYKYAAYELKDMEFSGAKAYYKTSSIPDEVKCHKEQPDVALMVRERDMTLSKLNEIFQSVLRKQVDKVDPIRSKFKNIEKEEVSLEKKMTDIRGQVRGLKGISFRTLLEMQPTRSNIIVTFLAVLELMKVGSISIRQDELFGDIVVDSLEEI